MKKYIHHSAIFPLLFVLQAYIATASTNEWGLVTNSIQMAISLDGDKREIKTNEPVILLVRIRNTSTNEIFQIYSMNDGDDPQFSFLVISPSGKDISPIKESSPTGSGHFIRIDSSRIAEVEFSLSRHCKFSEIGEYKIVAKREVDSITTRKAYLVVSNPIYLTVVSDK
jgi:hypothetical protein